MGITRDDHNAVALEDLRAAGGRQPIGDQRVERIAQRHIVERKRDRLTGRVDARDFDALPIGHDIRPREATDALDRVRKRYGVQAQVADRLVENGVVGLRAEIG